MNPNRPYLDDSIDRLRHTLARENRADPVRAAMLYNQAGKGIDALTEAIQESIAGATVKADL